ncbi:chaperonin 10-like protein [Boeremia exigua]|uniref:chaperonin 10-like protein n=1 Tax=Boeremia exigua TaxID=749465 RepID=UPI001E8E6333|nr:chaperonin 10-like protein [Boeremia exigua]KAH6639473.1 chaperonin 10-like protein [Boeremia exigua]
MSLSGRSQVQYGGDKPQFALKELKVPEIGDQEVLIKSSHVAQNPTDVQSFDGNAFGDGTVLGCDFVGKVEEIGKNVSRYKKGDTVAALIWGGEVKGHGAYSEYTIANELISFEVPGSISPEAAATVPLACCTAWLALLSKDCLGIDRKSGKQTSVLIWGGSSSVGLYAIQIARQHNFNIVTVCSPKHHDRVKSLGADHVFDYKSDDVANQIKSVAPNIQYIFDTIGDKSSSATASYALGEEGGTLCTVRPGKANTEDVSSQTKVTDVLVWTAFLKDHQYKDFKWPANPADHKLSVELFENLPLWLDDGTIKPNEHKLLNGLEKVPEGFQEYRDGKISGYKLVYAL